METAVSRIPVTMPVKKEDIAFHVLTKKSAIDWKNEHMLSQIPTKKSLIAVQTSFHEVPNQPRNTSAVPLSIYPLKLAESARSSISFTGIYISTLKRI